MPLLFSYGTLQQDDIQVATFGRRLHGSADTLPGFAKGLLPIGNPEEVTRSGMTHYANVTFTGEPASLVAGTVFEVTDAELARSDDYEAPAGYGRIVVPLSSGRQAWVYLHASGTRTD
ncbi:hypothetical protein BAC2_01819 [uncultured bacterium]|nr:hypothetical protein BAC2_01819 [uncultured bacterium]